MSFFASPIKIAWLVMIAATGFVAAASAQSNVEVNAGVQFDFLSPGARSLAMGSAFVGAADDATAAFVNPAGLRALSRKEVSFEARGRGFDIPISVGGRLTGAPTGIPLDVNPNRVEELQSQNAAGLSFLSFVYPRSRWAVAGYRHELANIDANVETRGAFGSAPITTANPRGVNRRLPIRGSMDLDIVAYGVSGSFNLTNQVSLGGGLAIYDLQMDSRTDRFDVNNDTGTIYTTPVFYGEPSYDPGNLENYQLQQGDDTAVGFSLGAVWAPTNMFQLGAIYRQGPEFELQQIANYNPTTNEPFPDRDFDGEFNVPHVVGVGARFRPVTNATLVVDITHVQYSRLTDGFVDGLFGPPDPGSYEVQDATEVHFGFEYVLPRRIPLAFRSGYWFDPEHSLVFSPGATAVEAARLDAEVEAQVFRPGEDQHHFTFGAGVVFGRFEINGAGDISDRTNTASLSAVVRF